jgi:hypothetical protein
MEQCRIEKTLNGKNVEWKKRRKEKRLNGKNVERKKHRQRHKR